MKISSGVFVMLPVLSLVLMGCSKTKQVFGLNKTPPNEFTVMERAPLELPPDYNLLPPQPGVERPQEASALKSEDKAKEAVLKKTTRHKKVLKTTAEKNFLEQAHIKETDSNIRSQVNSEAYIEENERDEKNWLREKLPFYKEKEGKNVLDPKKEAERLRKEKT